MQQKGSYFSASACGYNVLIFAKSLKQKLMTLNERFNSAIFSKTFIRILAVTNAVCQV